MLAPDGSPPDPLPTSPDLSRDPHDTPPVVPDHEMLQPIGRGAFGSVWLARNAMGRYRAVKIVHSDGSAQDSPFVRERSGIERFEPLSRNHEGFVDLLHVGFSPDQKFFYCVMELADDLEAGQNIDPARYRPCTLGSLLARQRRLPVKRVMEIGLSLAEALDYLHENRFIHRDVKPSNVIFVEGRAKIADIGLVAEIGGSRSLVGTPGYVPPEGAGTAAADIYALGKVLYEAASGRDRFDYPALPDDLEELPDRAEFLELNLLLLKACASDATKRYSKVADLASELRLVLAGRSLQLLRRLERFRRYAILAGAAALAGLAVGGLYFLRARWEGEVRARQLATYLSTYGSRLVEDGDVFGSLPWYTEALQLSTNDPQRATNFRRHIALVHRYSPRLTHMEFYPGSVAGAAFDAVGARLAIGASSNLVGLFDLEAKPPRVRHLQVDSEPSADPEGTGDISGLRFTPDGRELVAGGNDAVLRTWDALTGKEQVERRLRVPDRLAAFDFDRGFHRLATLGRRDRALRLWDWSTRTNFAVWTNHTETPISLSYSPDARSVATSGQDGLVFVCDADTGRPTIGPLRHPSWVFKVIYTPDGAYLVTACYDHYVRVWDPATGKQVREFRHSGPVRDLCFNSDGRWLATASYDGTVRVWDFDEGGEVVPPLRHENGLTSLAFAPDGRRLASTTRSGSARIWDLAPLNPWAAEDTRSDRLVSSPHLRGDGISARLARVTSAGVELRSEPMHTRPETTLPVTGVVDVLLGTQPALALVVRAAPTPTLPNRVELTLWDPVALQPIGSPFHLDVWLAECVLLSPDASRLAVFPRSGMKALLLDTKDGHTLAEFPQDPSNIPGAAFSPDLAWFAISDHADVHVLRLDQSERLRFTNEAIVSHLVFSPDSRTLAVSCSDDTLSGLSTRLWNLSSRSFGPDRLAHLDGAIAASFSPDQQQIVTVGEDWMGKIWRPTANHTWTNFARLGHPDQVIAASHSPDGRLIATGDYSRRVRVWDARTGEAVTPPLRDSFAPYGVQILPDNRWLLASSRTGKGCRLWNISPELPSDDLEDLHALSHVLSCVVADPTGMPLRVGMDQLTNAWTRLVTRGAVFQQVSEEEIRDWTQREQALRAAYANQRERQRAAELQRRSPISPAPAATPAASATAQR